MRLEFKVYIAYLILNSIVATDGSLQRSDEAFMAKMYLTWF